MNQEELKKIIPHRNSMLLVDEAEKVGENKAVGKKFITGKEWFLDGHFPGRPIVPGVILCEIMAQASAVIMGEKSAASMPLFVNIKNARFKGMVLPGDTLDIECTLLRSKGMFYFIEGKGSVNGELRVSAEFAFALVERE